MKSESATARINNDVIFSETYDTTLA